MRSALAAVVSFVLACRNDADLHSAPAPPLPAGSPKLSSDAVPFGLYLLALTWSPSFCCGHPGSDQCSRMDNSYAATHLTLHGLWPQYGDGEAKGREPYPSFCGSFAKCERGGEGCSPDPGAVPAEMRELGPGYVGNDRRSLAAHEWAKHGSCTGLAAPAYFEAALSAIKSLPEKATPKKLADAIGGDLALHELQSAFGIPVESVLLGCDDHCRLEQVGICLGHDEGNRPTKPVACPSSTSRARYTNGCVTRRCERVAIPAAGRCELEPRDQRQRPHQRACDRPGQGPVCTGDDSCKQQGYKRCARSGCCTSQP